MKEIQQKIGIANENWLMSAREKLTLIGLLDCLKPKKVIEFGFHRGGATKWLSQYAEKVITVDVKNMLRMPLKHFHMRRLGIARPWTRLRGLRTKN